MDRDSDDPDNLSAPPSMADSFERLLAEPADAIAAPLTVGSVVAGRYEVVERIGAGAMGMVYLAKDRDLERKIALKLHKKRAGTEQLRREALAMARLAHPNVVTVFEVGEHEGRTFVAMEYVAGTTLRQWLAAERRTPGEILDMLASAGEGLIAAHEAKLVHRDFKPENVLIGSDSRARVSDFGLARETGHEVGAAAGGIGASTGVAGTPAYMAPEQALGISVDARADQYAFCGVAWEALVGSWPRNDKPTRNPRIRRVLERGLSKDPSARYPTMRALLSALRAARSRRHVVLGGVAALIVGGATVAFAWPTSDPAAVCNTAGIESIPLALDIPARLAAAQQSPTVVALVEKRLADYRASHLATARKVCLAGRVDRTWAADLYRRGVTCLELRRRVLLEQFGDPSATAAQILDRVVRINAPTSCADATVLASQPALPDDPAAVDEIIRVRAVLDSSLCSNCGTNKRLTDAIALAEASNVRTHPVIAPRIEFVKGMEVHGRGERAEGQALLTKAYFAARAIDDPELALAALVNLILSLGDGVPNADLKTWLANGEADAQRARTRAPEAAARLYLVAAASHDGFGDHNKGLALLEEAHTLVGDAPSRSLADVLMIRASMLITAGKPALAYADYVRAISMFEGLYGKDHPVVGKIKVTASAGMDALGRKDEGIRLAREGEAILSRDPSLSATDLAQVKLNVAASHINAGHYKRGKELLAEARALTLKVMGPDDPDLALIDANHVYALVMEKDYKAALDLAKETLVLMDRTTPKPHEDRGQLYLSISDAHHGLGELEPAITFADASASEYPSGDERKIGSLVNGARAANDAGQPARAQALLDKIRALPRPEDPILQGRIGLEQGRALASRDPAKARAALEAAKIVFTQANETTWVQRVDAARAKLR